MTVLLLSTGGGGGNILRSLKALFRRDLAVAQSADPKYAERLRRAITTRFLDTNEFSLSAVPKEERVIIGAATTGGLGARHNPEIAAQALEESKAEVQQLLNEHSVIVIIGTGGKGTGAGTTFPLAQMARQQKKLVIPIFVLPSFERHEVEKRRYDHALHVASQFDSAGIRLMEILNDRGYADTDPQPQSVVWERMNLPIARGLRGLLYVLWDLSQVDPSDLSILFAGPGRLRIGFSELNPPAGQEPDDDEIKAAVRTCWENPYCAFNEAPGTSLVCIQGDWSNVVDGKIKAELAALALGGAKEGPYNPLYARAARVPRPWGLTTLFSGTPGIIRRSTSIGAPREKHLCEPGFSRTPEQCRSNRRHRQGSQSLPLERSRRPRRRRRSPVSVILRLPSIAPMRQRSSKQRTVCRPIFGSRSAS